MTGRLPSMRGIEAFINAAETLSFRVAAERLHITVSAMSHRIHALEAEIGLPLFYRSGRTLALTVAGEAYRELLLPLFDAMRSATEAMHKSANSTVVRVASFQLFHAHWLAPRIAGYLAAHPGATIEMTTLRRSQTSHRDFEVVMVRPGETRPGDTLLFDWIIEPVCRPDLIEAFGITTPADLLSARLIESSVADDVWPTWFAHVGVQMDRTYDTVIADTPAMTMELAAAGAGVALTTSFQETYQRTRGLVRPFHLPCPYPGAVVLRRPGGGDRPAVAAFEAWLLDEVAQTNAAERQR